MILKNYLIIRIVIIVLKNRIFTKKYNLLIFKTYFNYIQYYCNIVYFVHFNN